MPNAVTLQPYLSLYVTIFSVKELAHLTQAHYLLKVGPKHLIVWSLNYITAVFKMQHLAMFNFSSDILKFKTFVTVFFIFFCGV